MGRPRERADSAAPIRAMADSADSAAEIRAAAAPRATGERTLWTSYLRNSSGNSRRLTATGWSPWCSTVRPRRATIRRSSPISTFFACLSEITPRELAAGEDIFRWWREQGSPSPLLLTEQEVATFDRLFRDRVSRYPAPAPAAVRQGRDYRAGDGRFVLPRRRWSTICAPSCCGCGRRRAGCFPIPTCCGACCWIRFRLFASCSGTRCILTGVDAPVLKRDVHRARARAVRFRCHAFRETAGCPRGAHESRAKSNRWPCWPRILKEIAQVIDAVDSIEK